MKHKLTALVLCLAMLAALAGCGGIGTEAAEYRFYYYCAEPDYSAEHPLIRPEVRESESYDSFAELLTAYFAGPLDPALQLPLPRDTVLTDWRLENGTLRLDFSRELSLLTGVDLSVACGCIAQTFFALPQVRRVVITAGDALLEGQGAITLTPDQLLLRDDSMDRLVAEYTLYYLDTDRRYLIAREETVNLASLEGLESYLVERLLEPAEGSGLSSALPLGTRVLGIQVTDGVCTVNLSREFEANAFGSVSDQRLTLLSVVNTLTQLEDISQVEFAVEGDLLLRYGLIRIDEPLQREEEAIGPVRTALGEFDATVFLGGENERLLMPVPTRIKLSAGVSREEAVVLKLLSYRSVNGLTAGNESGAVLRSVTVTDGICQVELSAEVLSEPDRIPMLARCLTASLCALEGVEGVKLLVEGEIPDSVDSGWFQVLTPQNDWFL